MNFIDFCHELTLGFLGNQAVEPSGRLVYQELKIDEVKLVPTDKILLRILNLETTL
jgi:hypothetical protein